MLQALKRFVDNDPRILWFNENLDRQQQIKLLEVADCFVSLHRGEGFGRVIAESMLCKTPCIVSDYSGNVDFCDEKSCFLVDGKKVYNKGKDYILSDEFFGLSRI